MPPKVKFYKEEIVAAALRIVERRGIEAVTAREVARELGVSTRPIFTYYDTMSQLRGDVYELAKRCYREYVMHGLAGPTPFLGVGQQYVRFAKEHRHLYRLLFLTRPDGVDGTAMEVLRYSQDLVRESLMRIYHMSEREADNYFRDLWLVAFSFATMVVTDDCPFTDEQMNAIFAEMSLSVCKAYKEVPGLSEGVYDKDAIFEELVRK